MKKFLKIVMYLVLFVVMAFIALIITAVISDYDPEKTTIVAESQNTVKLSDSLEFTVTDWNIGYCGLDKSMDFFYDGGVQVRPAKENIDQNLSAIIKYLKSEDSTDFFLLQEVDKKSKRSYKVNEYDSLKFAFPEYHSYFGKNYDVFFVPTPPTNPYGNVVSGLMSISRFEASSVVRHSFPGNYAFPKGLFMLDRCFMVQRFKIENGKELLIINTHNSAYDDGSLRSGQMEYLKNFLIEEFTKGNYIVVGGDWNQCPPDIQPEIEGFIFDKEDYSVLDENYLPADWKWVFSNDKPTNRRVMQPWNKSTTPVTIIDYFLISPNVENLSFKIIEREFENSDHQPIQARFKLIK